jgi:4-amino-4-deoxy-L-arabinose transferase-like glycosyltransferase
VRSLERPRAGWWLTAGLALGLATAVRTVGVAIVCLAVLWILLVGRAPDNSRPTVMRFLRSLHMRRAAITAAAAIVLLLYYSDAQGRQTGSYGLTRTAGFNLYLRVSPYYDCTRFTPPAGTQALCAKRAPPPAQYVQGPFLVWCPGYPGLCAFGYPPDANAKLSDFAFAVIAHQPGDYLHAVLKDLGRYIAPPSFYSQTALQRLLHDAANEQAAIPRMAVYYKTAGFTRSDVGALDTYGRIFHIGGIALAIMVAIALASLGLCRGRTRTLAILLTAVGLLLLVAPVITSHYEPRYAVPAYGPLAAAAAFAIEAAIVRRRHAARRQPPAGAAES